MKRRSKRNVLVIFAAAVALTAGWVLDIGRAEARTQSLRGRIIAVGIPGACAISPVGTFLPGGPIHDNAAFAAYTQPGRILDPVQQNFMTAAARRFCSRMWRGFYIDTFVCNGNQSQLQKLWQSHHYL